MGVESCAVREGALGTKSTEAAMVSNEQEAQQIVIRHIGGFAWPTLLLLVSCAFIYLTSVAHLLTDPTFSWWALAGIAFCTYAI